MAVNVRGLLLLRAAPRTANVETGPDSGHHKELNSANHLNELRGDPEPQLTQEPSQHLDFSIVRC